MSDSEHLLGVRKLERLFSQRVDVVDMETLEQKSEVKSKFRLEHLFWIPSLLFKRFYRLLPPLFKDLFYWLSILHKAPSTKIFARTRYDELRTLIDIKVSWLVTKLAPSKLRPDVEQTFKLGFYTSMLENVSALDELVEGVVKYAKPSHAGARPYFKDGKNEQIDNSFSAYYTFSGQDNSRITEIIREGLGENFDFHLSSLAGYKCSAEDISYSLGIVFGENSNSEMHQDTYSSVAKGFLYLQDISVGNSPFEYLEGSYTDAVYRSQQTNRAVLEGDEHSSGSTRLRGATLKESLDKYRLRSFIGSKGLFVLANTAGYHRKGPHDSTRPRITLSCGVVRKGIIEKLFLNVFGLIKTKLS